MYASFLRGRKGFAGGRDVGFVGAGKAANRRAFHLLGYLPCRLKLGG
jgi:hypothetical protein